MRDFPCSAEIADNTAKSFLKGDQTVRMIHRSIGMMLLLALALPLRAESINPPTAREKEPRHGDDLVA
ncbi:MAG: hypothetical protein DMG11_30785 [Acidobacteria bacterium]|nr:MAG: hypothetical protein DMG11_30785 [Acidobacteriota bacterium]